MRKPASSKVKRSAPAIVAKRSLGAGDLLALRHELGLQLESLKSHPEAYSSFQRLCDLGCDARALLLFRWQAVQPGTLWSFLLPLDQRVLVKFPRKLRQLAKDVELLIPRLEAAGDRIGRMEASIFGMSKLRQLGQIESLPGPVNLDDLPHCVGFFRLYADWIDKVYAERAVMWRGSDNRMRALARLALGGYVAQITRAPNLELTATFVDPPVLATRASDEPDSAKEYDRRIRAEAAPLEAYRKFRQRKKKAGAVSQKYVNLVRTLICDLALQLVTLDSRNRVPLHPVQ